MKFSFLSRVVVLSTLLGTLLQSTLVAQANPLQNGINSFKKGDYETALEQFREAEKKQPKDVQTQMWLGLALNADGKEWEAMSAWRNGTGSPKWEPVADYLRGLAWWKMGAERDAIRYFEEALLNTRDGKAVSFPPARDAIKRVKAGESAPEISNWPDLSTLTKAAQAVNAPAAKPAVKPAAKPIAKTAAKKPAVTPVKKATGAKPRAGRWVATISNGYKGDTLTFRVSADGKRIENVEFKGYWSKRDGRGIEMLRDLDPPAPFPISGGAFSGTQNVSKSRMWWELVGRFKSATTAEGTYRCAYAGGEYDTYQLKWTARYVSS